MTFPRLITALRPWQIKRQPAKKAGKSPKTAANQAAAAAATAASAALSPAVAPVLNLKLETAAAASPASPLIGSTPPLPSQAPTAIKEIKDEV